ncbi:MDR family MFS transporter [Cytobacillus purgationiresistens]|uniref:MFS family permease n=1 Tax=Cytobacillus purgationiresistens TaxID=863449 RepID=A0ABU0ARE5_9BACI|nr:MFS transporter [Cytobacillus purgationiresistens]MDQ0273790.1 MFS family permease [Cytobacillus purgationiresistens]
MQKRIRSYFDQFHQTVWVLLIGTVLSRGAAFMTMPFLAIYLSRQDLHPIFIGLTIGMSPLMGTIGGFIGGHLSDRYGRKPIMLIALIGTAFSYLSFALVESPYWFILLNAVLGLCNSFFEPTAQALMGDLTSKEKRMKVYSLRYIAINIGASVGPLIGAFLAMTNAKLTFLITGTIYFLYAIILYIMIKKVTASAVIKNKTTLSQAFNIVKKDRALRFFILGGILIAIGYSQVESNLPQHLTDSVENSVMLYSILLSLNAIVVVLLQLPFSTVMEKYQPMQMMVVGSILTIIGLLSFGFATTWTVAIIGMVLFTFGEILSFPSSSLLIDQLAEDHLRGTYFGASQFRNVGSFGGPILGGFLLSQVGGVMAFVIISIICLGSIAFFSLGNRVNQIKETEDITLDI